MIRTSLEGTVGVLLDELPEGLRERAADELSAESEAFWQARARAQVSLGLYRLVFRNFFYDEEENKGQLLLPPGELWNFEILSEPKRVEQDGHDLVVVDFEMTSTLFTNAESVGEAEQALVPIGGTWDEPFVFPLDPELLLQRTGYACMDEAEFPPNSVDGENVATFYDQECEAGENDCHVTEIPDEDCVEALERAVGAVETTLRFERVAWDPEARGQRARRRGGRLRTSPTSRSSPRASMSSA